MFVIGFGKQQYICQGASRIAKSLHLITDRASPIKASQFDRTETAVPPNMRNSVEAASVSNNFPHIITEQKSMVLKTLNSTNNTTSIRPVVKISGQDTHNSGAPRDSSEGMSPNVGDGFIIEPPWQVSREWPRRAMSAWVMMKQKSTQQRTQQTQSDWLC